jgi:hypothetical protein
MTKTRLRIRAQCEEGASDEEKKNSRQSGNHFSATNEGLTTM